MAEHDDWDGPARESGRDDWNAGRSPSPRAGGTPPRREQDRSRSPRRDDMRGRSAANSEGDQNPGNNLHVSGVSNKVTERDLDEAFGKFGKVLRSQVMYDPHSREPRGFAFVTMDTVEGAEAAISNMNGAELQGRTLSVQRARRGRARTPTPGRYYGPPKAFDKPGPPYPRSGGYPPPPADYRYGGPPPMRDPYDRYPPRSPPPRDPYDRYARPPPRDYPPRDYGPPPPPRGGYGGPPRGYSPPPRSSRYDDIPPPPRSRYDDIPPPPRSRYDDLPPPPPRSRYDDPPPRRY